MLDSVEGTSQTTLKQEESFIGSAGIPVKEELESQFGSQFTGFLQTKRGSHRGPFLEGSALLSRGQSFLDGFQTSLNISHESVTLGFELTQNESLISDIVVGVDEFTRESVGPSNNHSFGSHNIELQTTGLQTIEPFLAGDDNFSSHVSTLLGTSFLIFNVDTSGTSLSEEFGQLHGTGDTSKSAISIGNQRNQIVSLRSCLQLFQRHSGSGLSLDSVFIQQSFIQLLDLAGNGMKRVVGEIGTSLEGRVSSRGTLPSGNVDSFQILGLVHHLDGIQSTVSGTIGQVLLLLSNQVVQLLGSKVGRVFDLQTSTQRSNISGGVITFGVSPSGLSKPCGNFFFNGLQVGAFLVHLDLFLFFLFNLACLF
mmetsp:Transcript_14987/g.16630  ORF Transcript_14987/g.16630 Transcript_14987/m.16630 type:complete len:367 (-) Transcript_14987:40-1140(-)